MDTQRSVNSTARVTVSKTENTGSNPVQSAIFVGDDDHELNHKWVIYESDSKKES